MSIKVMNMVFDRYPVGGNEGMLALAIADHAHDDGTRIWPSLDHLAHKTKQSRSSVRRHLKGMMDRGWLELVKRSDGRLGGTNEYRINPAWIEGRLEIVEGVNLTPSPPCAEGCEEDVDKPEGEGAKRAGEGVTAVVGEGVTAVVPESSGTVIEPSIPPNPPSGTGGGGQNAKQPNSKPAKRVREKDRMPWRWADARSEIEKRGAQLAIAPWDQRPPSLGGEMFSAYAARVFASHLATQGVTTTPALVKQAIDSDTKWGDVLRQLADEAEKTRTQRSST